MIPLACTLHFAFLKGTRINFNTVSTNTETTISQAIIHMDCGINKPRIFLKAPQQQNALALNNLNE